MSKEDENEEMSDTGLPAHPTHVHLMGIGGTGMASLAGMFLGVGSTVTGSDNCIYPPMSDVLRDLGIRVMEGYRPANLSSRPDLVVVGNVIRRDNPEAVELESSGIAFTSMPVALRRYFAWDRTRIVVAGTHGKTTVSSMIAWILYKEGLDPGFMIGGVTENFRSNYRLGKGRFFVIEGDEYDTAYFDKRAKFLHYYPHIGVVTSCEFDHADIYRDLEQIEDQFRSFVGSIPGEGRLVVYGGDTRVPRPAGDSTVVCATYGFDSGLEWRAGAVRDVGVGIEAEILKDGIRVASGTIPVVGLHNVLNALAAIAAVEAAGVTPERALDALASFRGVKRRQEKLGEAAGVTVLDDFAHHPTAVRETCAGVRSRYRTGRLVAVFEPGTNTSKRSIFQEAYASAFDSADLIVVREPRKVENIPPSRRFSSRRLASDLKGRGKEAVAFADTEGIPEYLAGVLRESDIVLVMSNGSFDNVGARLLKMLGEGAT